MAVRLVSEAGTEVFTSRDELSNGGKPGEKPWDLYGYAKQIPLKDVPAGRYMLRVEAQVRGDDDVKPYARETIITVVDQPVISP
jgi:hypothetical protein